jgi:hypothetical protein
VTAPQPPRAPLDLRRPRDLGALLNDAFGLYLREFGTLFLVAAAVVVPVELIVRGAGLGQFTASYDPTPAPAVTIVPALAEVLVISPLLTAMSIYALLDVAGGRRPRARSVIQRGLDVFGALLVVVLLFAAAFIMGLFAFLVGAVVVATFLAFSMQAAVIEDRRGADALRRSFELVRGSFWRVLGIALLAYLLTQAGVAVVTIPFVAAADATGEAIFQLVGAAFGIALFAPPFALVMTLLYFDQRTRRGDPPDQRP